MFFWCTAPLLALASTMVHGAPLASLASNLSSNTLFERGLERNPCSLKGLCLLKVHEVLSSQRDRYGHFNSAEDRRNPQWPEMIKYYAESQAMFTEAIWSTYPSMKRHLEIVYHLILEPGFYTSTGQPIDPGADGAEISRLEAQIARMVIICEIITRGGGDKRQIDNLTSDLMILVGNWHITLGKTEYTSPERKNAYFALQHKLRGRHLAFYDDEKMSRADEGPWTEQDVRKEAEEQKIGRKLLDVSEHLSHATFCGK